MTTTPFPFATQKKAPAAPATEAVETKTAETAAPVAAVAAPAGEATEKKARVRVASRTPNGDDVLYIVENFKTKTKEELAAELKLSANQINRLVMVIRKRVMAEAGEDPEKQERAKEFLRANLARRGAGKGGGGKKPSNRAQVNSNIDAIIENIFAEA